MLFSSFSFKKNKKSVNVGGNRKKKVIDSVTVKNGVGVGSSLPPSLPPLSKKRY